MSKKTKSVKNFFANNKKYLGFAFAGLIGLTGISQVSAFANTQQPAESTSTETQTEDVIVTKDTYEDLVKAGWTIDFNDDFMTVEEFLNQ